MMLILKIKLQKNITWKIYIRQQKKGQRKYEIQKHGSLENENARNNGWIIIGQKKIRQKFHQIEITLHRKLHNIEMLYVEIQHIEIITWSNA